MNSISFNIPSPTIAFIGGGNMARSLIGGLVRTGCPASAIAVSEPNANLRDQLKEEFQIIPFHRNESAARERDILVLAVKPQIMKTVCSDLLDVVQTYRPLVISIAAGIRSIQIEQWLGGNLPVVRAMPNTPALIGAGATGLYANAQVTEKQRARAEEILATVGLTVWIEQESWMDTVTAISGSGPAYFFLLVETLEEAAVQQGLPREIARSLAIQTAFGAGRMLYEVQESPQELRERVTSPGGTTSAALSSLANNNFQKIVTEAISAATERGRALSAQFD